MLIDPTDKAENLTLVREANHRFANHLAVIVSAVNRQLSALGKFPDRAVPQAAVRSMLEEVSTTVYAIAELNRLLARNPLAGVVDLGELLTLTTQTTISSLGLRDRLRIRLEATGGTKVSHDKAHSILLIVSEALMNAIKYAHPSGLPVIISLRCACSHTGALRIDISDDGVGLPEGFNPERDGGTGFKVMRVLAHSLGATLAFDSTPLGLSVRLALPLEARAPMRAMA